MHLPPEKDRVPVWTPGLAGGGQAGGEADEWMDVWEGGWVDDEWVVGGESITKFLNMPGK